MDPPVSLWRRITFIEPVTFFIMFAFALSDSVITDAIVYKTCKKIMKENSSECSILHENSSSDAAKDLQNIVQPHIATLLVAKTSIETFFPVLSCLFLGPWSDTNGRKPLLTFPLIGSVLYYALFSIISKLDIDAHWFLVPSTISSVMGGYPTIFLVCFCYIADITNDTNRAWRLCFLDFVLFGGQLVGLIVSPYAFKQFGYCIVFAISAVACCLALFYSYFLLKETIYIGLGRSAKTIFDASEIKSLFRFLTRKRSRFDRFLFACCICIIAIHDDNMQGSATILYLFTKRFGWSLLDFSTYSAIQLIVTMLGMLLLIKVIAPVFKLSETTSIIAASLSNCGNSLMKAFAQESWHIYLSTGIGAFCLAPASLIRSVISKTVDPHDVGKAFAISTTMERLGPFVTTPLFIYLHTNFIKMYPSPVWFLPAGLSLTIVILAILVQLRWTKMKDREMQRN